MNYATKYTPIKFKDAVEDVDDKRRLVKGALSKTDYKDQHGDIVVAGAFAKSIQERGPKSSGNRKIAALRFHDMNHPVGVYRELYEEDGYLKFVVELSKSQQGTDLLEDYKLGVAREHSIGYMLVEDKYDYSEDAQAWIIREVKLFEGSQVTFGANEETPTFAVGDSAEKASDWLRIYEAKAQFLKDELAGYPKGQAPHSKVLEYQTILTHKQKAAHFLRGKPSSDTSDKGKPSGLITFFQNI